MESDVIIVGGGLAGLAAAHDLLLQGKQVLLFDRNGPDRLGGLAKWSMGGLFYVDSPFQRRARIRDSEALALQDWLSYAELEPGDLLPRAWAEQYVSRCTAEVYEWLKPMGLRYVPSVQWVERGLDRPGNSVPRFHVVWGGGWGLVEALTDRLEALPQRANLRLLYRHDVSGLLRAGERVTGVLARDLASGETREWRAGAVILAAGGITGDLGEVRRHWRGPGKPPERLLSGSHPVANGDIHRLAAEEGAQLTHLDLQWNYAAGVQHPEPSFPGHGLSLIPPKSGAWLNFRGERMGPRPLVSGYDTRFLVERICQEEEAWSWIVVNRRIAWKELGVSGSALNDALREQDLPAFVASLIWGNRRLLRRMQESCPDFVQAGSPEALAAAMNRLEGRSLVEPSALRATLEAFDREVALGPQSQDEQIRLLARLREYSGDRLRTCRSQPLLEPSAGPLIAIRASLLTRKTLGGIQTDLRSRVLRPDGQAIEGLYAVGECAGFGGGGIHGKRALEGTFLGNCVLTARVAARDLA